MNPKVEAVRERLRRMGPQWRWRTPGREIRDRRLEIMAVILGVSVEERTLKRTMWSTAVTAVISPAEEEKERIAGVGVQRSTFAAAAEDLKAGEATAKRGGQRKGRDLSGERER